METLHNLILRRLRVLGGEKQLITIGEHTGRTDLRNQCNHVCAPHPLRPDYKLITFFYLENHKLFFSPHIYICD